MLWLKHISPLPVPPVPHNQVCLRSDIVGWSDPQTERMLHCDHVLIVGSKMLGSLRSVFGPRYDLSWSGGSFPICFRPAKALDKQTSRHARYDIIQCGFLSRVLKPNLAEAGVFFCPKFQQPARPRTQNKALRPFVMILDRLSWELEDDVIKILDKTLVYVVRSRSKVPMCPSKF